MGEGLERGPPKIQGLIQAHKENPEAFEASLIERGLRWRDVGSARFTWSDCWAVISTLPFDAPLSRAQAPDEWMWAHPWTQYIVHAGENAMLQKGVTKSERKGLKDRDLNPTPRPGQKEKERLEADAMPVADMRQRLGFSI